MVSQTKAFKIALSILITSVIISCSNKENQKLYNDLLLEILQQEGQVKSNLLFRIYENTPLSEDRDEYDSLYSKVVELSSNITEDKFHLDECKKQMNSLLSTYCKDFEDKQYKELQLLVNEIENHTDFNIVLNAVFYMKTSKLLSVISYNEKL